MCVRNVINIHPVRAYYIDNSFSTVYTVLYVDPRAKKFQQGLVHKRSKKHKFRLFKIGFLTARPNHILYATRCYTYVSRLMCIFVSFVEIGSRNKIFWIGPVQAPVKLEPDDDERLCRE